MQTPVLSPGVLPPSLLSVFGRDDENTSSPSLMSQPVGDSQLSAQPLSRSATPLLALKSSTAAPPPSRQSSPDPAPILSNTLSFNSGPDTDILRDEAVSGEVNRRQENRSITVNIIKGEPNEAWRIVVRRPCSDYNAPCYEGVFYCPCFYVIYFDNKLLYQVCLTSPTGLSFCGVPYTENLYL